MSEAYSGRKFSCIFIDGIVPDPSDIISAGRSLAQLGIAPGFAGNISQRHPGGILITSGGSVLSSLSPEDIVLVVSFEDEVARVVGGKEPSSELPMHSMIYASFECNGIVHEHDELLLSNAGKLGIPVADPAPYGTIELAENSCRALQDSDIIGLKDHGILSIGSDLEHALSNIVDKREKIDKRKE